MRQLYMGSYNAPVLTGDGTVYQGDGKGITRCEFNEETGELEERESIPQAQNASWLALPADRKTLYAVNELDDHEGTKGGALSAYEVQKDGSLRLLNCLPVMGAAPCHVDCAPAGKRARHVYTANYNGGSMSAFALKEDGSLDCLETLLQHEPRREKEHSSFTEAADVEKGKICSPHVHSAGVYDGLLWITDLGLDTVEAYRLDENGALCQREPSPVLSVRLSDGSGPRSLAFFKNRIFVSCELSNQVAVLEAKDGALTLIRQISALPGGTETESHVGGICLSPDGRHLYVGNRGHDSIAVFSVEADGLQPIQWASTGGRNPRGFCLSPSGKWLLAANQGSGTLSVLQRDERSGMLRPAGEYEARAVVCLLFL